ncbi:MAG: hypothetical protein QF787_01590 [Nitrospinota bacterium]|nr:hypothetical protein [Nitrospinota bacterium]
MLGATRLDDITSIGLEFESGPLGYIGVSQVIPLSIRTAAFGTEAAAWSEEDGTRLFFQKKGEQARSEIPVESGDAPSDQLREFASCIREGAAPETGGAEGLEVVAAMEAIIESAKSGRLAEVADFRA